MSTPSITPAQIKAVILLVFGIAAALGLPISAHAQDLILKLVPVIPTALILADAVIRHGRSTNAASVMDAKLLDAKAKAVASGASLPPAQADAS